MVSYRTIAGVGAAALAFLALSRVSKRFRKEAGENADEFIDKTKKRVQGVIRRRSDLHFDPANDVI